MKQLEQTYTITAPLAKVWQALVDPKVIDQWGGGPAVMNDQAGDNFSLWGGDIHGRNTKVVPEKLLEQDWYSDDWPEASKVAFSLSEGDGKTTLKLVHTDIPDDSLDDIDEGWKIYYLSPLKDLLES